MMKILFVNETIGFAGGLEQYLFGLSKILAQLGHQCSLVFSKNSGKNPDQFDRYFLHRYQIDFSNMFKSDSTALKNIITQERPDIAFLHKVSNARLIREIHHQLPTVRMVHDVASFCPNSRKFYYFSGKLCQQRMGISCYFFPGCYRLDRAKFPFIGHGSLQRTQDELRSTALVDQVIVASRYMRDQLLLPGCPSQKLTVLQLFFDGDAYINYPMHEHQNIILFIGNVNKSKGPDLLVKALQFINSFCRIIMIGEGKELEYIRSSAARLFSSQTIEFVGWIDHEKIENYYKDAAMLVIPSRWPEPFGLVGLEAMAHAVPVIAFNVGGIPDWLEDGKNGFLVERGNIGQLAEKIELLLTDKNLNRQLGEYGRQCVMTKYNPNDYVKKLMAIFEQAIKSRQGY